MRLIDADALLDDVLNQVEFVKGFGNNELEDVMLVVFEGIKQQVAKMPTIEAEPIRHGKWIKMSDADGYYYACSECGEELYRKWFFDREFDLFPKKVSIDKTQYCPNCGSKNG